MRVNQAVASPPKLIRLSLAGSTVVAFVEEFGVSIANNPECLIEDGVAEMLTTRLDAAMNQHSSSIRRGRLSQMEKTA